MAILIAESGATKSNWALIDEGKKLRFLSPGINPYQSSKEEIENIFIKQVAPKTKKNKIDVIYFYGAGMNAPENKQSLKKILSSIFPNTKIELFTDLMASAHATCKNNKGIVSILGTGSGAAFYEGGKISKVRNGIGYILGDEGSGTYLGRKVIQYFLYKTFDEELMHVFEKKYNTTRDDILQHVYRMPYAAKYIAGFTTFLSENRGHYMIENIIEDGLNDFFVTHIFKFRKAWLYPLHFTGGVAFAFKDVLKELCNNYELELGNIIRYPIDGLIEYYKH